MMTEFEKTPLQEIKNRINTLKLRMDNRNIDAVFLTHKPDIFYFSGTAQDCYLYIHIDHDPILFVKRYLPRAQEESCIRQVIQIVSVKEVFKKIRVLQPTLPQTCGLAFDVVPVREFEFYQTLFDPVSFVDCSPVINICRQIKSAHEIEQLKKAARLSEKTFSFIRKKIKLI